MKIGLNLSADSIRVLALNPSKDIYEDSYFTIRYFQKGTAHLTFKPPELVEKMNDIIAKHYPDQLPPATNQRC